MSLKDWPSPERPREKLLHQGAAALSDAELLAIFLRTGSAGRSAVELARLLQSRYGGIRPLLTASLADFCTHAGLGPAKYAQLQAALGLSRRHLREMVSRPLGFESAEKVREYLQLQLRDHAQEVFFALFLNNRHRLIASEVLFHGTINAANVHVREVVKRDLQLNAAALIVAHNHPSGIAEPSRADIQLTARLSEALQLVDIRLLDHFVVGDGAATSLAERRLF